MKFMSDSNHFSDKWALGLNFFQDYYVEFTTTLGSKSIRLYPIDANVKRNHVSPFITKLAGDKVVDTEIIDNSNDSATQKAADYCLNKGGFDPTTFKCVDG